MGRIGNWLTPVLTARSQLLSPISADGLSLLFPEHSVPSVDRLPEGLAAYMKPAIFCRALNREALIGDTVTLNLSGDHNDLFNVTIPGWMNPDTAQITIYELKTLSKLSAHLSFTCDAIGIFDLYFGVVTNDTVKKLLGLSFNVCKATLACLDSSTPSTSPLASNYHAHTTLDGSITSTDFQPIPIDTTAISTTEMSTIITTTVEPLGGVRGYSSTTSTSTSTSAQSLASLNTFNVVDYNGGDRSSTARDPFDMATFQRHSHKTSTSYPTTSITTYPTTTSTYTTASTSTATTSSSSQAAAAPLMATIKSSSAIAPVLQKPPGVPQEAWDWFISTRNNRGRTETTPHPHTIVFREVVVPSIGPALAVAPSVGPALTVAETTTTSTKSTVTTSEAPSHPLAGKVLARLRRDRPGGSHAGTHRNRTYTAEGEEEYLDIDDEAILFDEVSLRAPPGAYNVYLEPAPINPDIVERLTHLIQA